jgi:hypothetical protein
VDVQSICELEFIGLPDGDLDQSQIQAVDAVSLRVGQENGMKGHELSNLVWC